LRKNEEVNVHEVEEIVQKGYQKKWQVKVEEVE